MGLADEYEATPSGRAYPLIFQTWLDTKPAEFQTEFTELARRPDVVGVKMHRLAKAHGFPGQVAAYRKWAETLP